MKGNLSELFNHVVISRVPQIEIGIWGDRRYWCGEDLWSTDPKSTDVIIMGAGVVQKSLDYLEELVGYCDLDVTPVKADMILIEWPCGQWVVANPQNRKLHRVNYVGTHDTGHYFKDEGTTERELVIQRNPECWSHVMIRGQRLMKATNHLLDGQVFPSGTLMIPHSTSLQYQFEYELEEFTEHSK